MFKFFCLMAMRSQEISPIMALMKIFGSRDRFGPPESKIDDLPCELNA